MFRFLLSPLLLGALVIVSCQSDPATSTNTQTTVAPTIDTTTGQPIRKENPWTNNTCDLLTDEEFCAVFNVDIKRDFANRRTLPQKAYCLRTWKKPDWREREIAEDKNPNIATNPESALAVEVINFGTEPLALTQFDLAKKDHINGYETEIAGLGDGALWSVRESMLLVKKSNLFLQIKLDHADNAADNLPKAKEVAAIMLKKI